MLFKVKTLEKVHRRGRESNPEILVKKEHLIFRLRDDGKRDSE